MEAMRSEGVKAVQVEVYLTWFFGPRRLRPVRVLYFTEYDGRSQIVDEKQLGRFRSIGLESTLKKAALRYAPQGHWVDLPFPIFLPFAAATSVILFEDEWLPTPPQMFTTFGPGRPPLIAAVGIGDEADVNRILSSGKASKQELNSALFFVCNDDGSRLLRRLLDAGADPNTYVDKRKEEVGYTPLMAAVWNHAPGAAETLLAAGARVNGAQGYGGETPLTLAAGSPSDAERIVLILLDKGADVNAANEYGLTALMDAPHRQPARVIELLVKRGADTNARDHQGRTALMFAAEDGNFEAVQVLLLSHPDISARNAALSATKDPKIAELLRNAGAR